jgi:peptide/nickel transport system permease protein
VSEGKPSASASTRGYWASVRRQFLAPRLNRFSLGVILTLFAVAAVADFVASDLPIAVKLDGRFYLFPNVTRPPALRSYDNQRLLQRMSEEDWAVFPPVPWGYNTHDLEHVLSPPSAEHWLGTDDSGRDVMSRVVHGSRVSLAVGLLSVMVLISIGVLIGSLSAYFGGILDLLLMRIVEIVHSVPTLLFLVTMLALIMPSGWWAVVAMMVVIGLVRWTDVARLVRGEILRIKTLEYVQAARLLGMSHARILIVHILPNAMSPVLVTATFAMASAILLEGALSFLGFGIPDDMASWGSLLNEVRGHTQAWWLAVFPGAAIFVTVTAYNLAGEGLRDAIDPRLRV